MPESYTNSHEHNILSIIIPVYNEENGIAKTINRIFSIRQGLPNINIDDLELIVVDDGSTDKTTEIVSTFPDVSLVSHGTH